MNKPKRPHWLKVGAKVRIIGNQIDLIRRGKPTVGKIIHISGYEVLVRPKYQRYEAHYYTNEIAPMENFTYLNVMNTQQQIDKIQKFLSRILIGKIKFRGDDGKAACYIIHSVFVFSHKGVRIPLILIKANQSYGYRLGSYRIFKAKMQNTLKNYFGLDGEFETFSHQKDYEYRIGMYVLWKDKYYLPTGHHYKQTLVIPRSIKKPYTRSKWYGLESPKR
jgi:hypothetical protein